MIRGLYSAATALDAAVSNQELVADNLANASTPGFRRHGLVFEAFQQAANTAAAQGGIRAAPNTAAASRASNVPAGVTSFADSALGTRASGQYTSFTPGALQYTGNPFDLALSGDNAFFVLDSQNGPVYTRNGTFKLDAQGQLQSTSGMTVRGSGGRITIPPTAVQVTIGRDGTIYADNTAVGQLQIAQFPQPGNVLQRAGTTLFSGPAPQQQSQGNATFRVEQGYRESSNVQVVNEMVSMITGMRHYEAAERALRALGEAVAQNTKPQ
jgi:flagellar basal-body rod protein FlgF